METTAVDSTLEPPVPLYQKERQEFTSVVERHMPCFHRMALRHLGNPADAEDAAQDALLSAYAHLNQFKGKARLSTWLTTIVINSARMKLRRRPTQLQVPLEHCEIHDTFFEGLSDHRPNPEQACGRWQSAEVLARFSTRLSTPLRRTFQLCDIEGLSIRETAEFLSVPEGTVKARLARARAILKHLMEKRFGGWRNAI